MHRPRTRLSFVHQTAHSPGAGHTWDATKGSLCANTDQLRQRLRWTFDYWVSCAGAVHRSRDRKRISARCIATSETTRPMPRALIESYENIPPASASECSRRAFCDPALAACALHLLRHLGVRGVAEIEFKRDDRDGKWKLIEINPRFSLQHGLVSAAGMNLASLQYFDLLGSSPASSPEYQAGVRWVMAGLDAQASLKQWFRGELSIAQWARSFHGLRAEALFASDDPGPALAYLSRTPRYLFETLSYRLTSARGAV